METYSTQKGQDLHGFPHISLCGVLWDAFSVNSVLYTCLKYDEMLISGQTLCL